MTMWFMLVHNLENLYLCCGVKGQTGFIQGQRVQGIFFAKNAAPFLMSHSMAMKLKYVY